jgi:hypothetical protein
VQKKFFCNTVTCSTGKLSLAAPSSTACPVGVRTKRGFCGCQVIFELGNCQAFNAAKVPVETFELHTKPVFRNFFPVIFFTLIDLIHVKNRCFYLTVDPEKQTSQNRFCFDELSLHIRSVHNASCNSICYFNTFTTMLPLMISTCILRCWCT